MKHETIIAAEVQERLDEAERTAQRERARADAYQRGVTRRGDIIDLVAKTLSDRSRDIGETVIVALRELGRVRSEG